MPLQVCEGAEGLGGEGRCLYLPPSPLSQAQGALCQLTQTQGILLGSVSACGRESRGGSVDLEVRVGVNANVYIWDTSGRPRGSSLSLYGVSVIYIRAQKV